MKSHKIKVRLFIKKIYIDNDSTAFFDLEENEFHSIKVI